jgi:hypothetical protein
MATKKKAKKKADPAMFVAGVDDPQLLTEYAETFNGAVMTARGSIDDNGYDIDGYTVDIYKLVKVAVVKKGEHVVTKFKA